MDSSADSVARVPSREHPVEDEGRKDDPVATTGEILTLFTRANTVYNINSIRKELIHSNCSIL